ncbi:MAG: hypothetical protein ABI377_08075 [Devosia sp.]
MSKWISRDVSNGKFIVGRGTAEKFSAVEGQYRSARTDRLIVQSDTLKEGGESRRRRIREEFATKK